MASMLAQWSSMEASFDMAPTISWMQQHAEVPVAAVGLYLGFIFTIPQVLQKPLNLKFSFAMWNLLLSVFSCMGVTRIVPHLVRTLSQEGFVYSVCEEPRNWYSKGPCGLWMTMFVLSKFPELGDTVFLVLRKKPVIFLHWFHHTTVLLYCWHATLVTAGPGIWFAAMNYSVHSVMYFYFFMANIGYAKRMQPLAPFITSIQILQMVGGMTCLITVAIMQNVSRSDCNVDPANWKLGLMMYASYFLLFGWLFIQKYLPKPSPEVRPTKEQLPTACKSQAWTTQGLTARKRLLRSVSLGL